MRFSRRRPRHTTGNPHMDRMYEMTTHCFGMFRDLDPIPFGPRPDVEMRIKERMKKIALSPSAEDARLELQEVLGYYAVKAIYPLFLSEREPSKAQRSLLLNALAFIDELYTYLELPTEFDPRVAINDFLQRESGNKNG